MRQSEKWLCSLTSQEILDAGDAEQSGDKVRIIKLHTQNSRKIKMKKNKHF